MPVGWVDNTYVIEPPTGTNPHSFHKVVASAQVELELEVGGSEGDGERCGAERHVEDAGRRLRLVARLRADDRLKPRHHLGEGMRAHRLEIERAAFAALFATQDRAVGMASFVQDGPGKAKFTGR